MKLVSVLSSRKSSQRFWLSPYVSQRSLRSTFLFAHKSAWLRFFIFTSLLICTVFLTRRFLLPITFFKTIIIAPMIYFITESLGALAQIIFTPTYPKSFPIHHDPLLASSLSHFWGRRWNLWVQDWLKDIGHFFRKKSSLKKGLYIFFVSGIFHEFMINLPYWLYFGKSYFGTMMTYFLIQAIGLGIDKKWLSGSNSLKRRIFLWLTVILPSPLFINFPILTFLGLHDG